MADSSLEIAADSAEVDNHSDFQPRRLSLRSKVTLGSVLMMATLILDLGYSPVRNLISLQSEADSRWADLCEQYQRRAEITRRFIPVVSSGGDLDPQLVSDLLRAEVSTGQCRVNPRRAPRDAADYASFVQSQSTLYKALSQVLSKGVRSAKLKGDQQFRNLVAQLLQVDNKLVQNQGRFVQSGIAYNNALARPPASIYGAVLGFRSRTYLGGATQSKTDSL